MSRFDPLWVIISEYTEGKALFEEAVQRSEVQGVDVLTSGPLPPNPAELLSSPQMSRLLRDLVSRYEQVLLDTPSFLAVTDAATVASKVDGVVLVVGRAQARQGSVRTASQQLADVHANCIGVVVNWSETDGVYNYYMQVPT